MTLENVLTILGFVVTLLGSIIAVAVVWGRFSEKVKNLKEQVEKIERENSHQHDEFYETQRQADRLTERMDKVLGMLAEMKLDIKELKTTLDRIPQDRSAGK